MSNGNKQVYLCNIIRYCSRFGIFELCFVNYSFSHFALSCLIQYSNTEFFLLLFTQIQLFNIYYIMKIFSYKNTNAATIQGFSPQYIAIIIKGRVLSQC